MPESGEPEKIDTGDTLNEDNKEPSSSAQQLPNPPPPIDVTDLGSGSGEGEEPGEPAQERGDGIQSGYHVFVENFGDIPANNKDKWDHLYARIDLFINAIVGISTVALLVLTLWSLDLTREAIGLSRSAFNEARVANNRAREANQISRDAYQSSLANSAHDDTIADKNIELSNKSLQAQIDLINSNRKQFEVLNDPNLEADSFNFSPNLRGESMMTILVRNIGNYPAKIISLRPGYFFYGELRPNTHFNEKEMITRPFNKYVTGSKPLLMRSFMTHEDYTAEINNQLNDLKLFLYFSLTIEYENLITKKKKLYKYFAKVASDGERSSKILVNENTYLNK